MQINYGYKRAVQLAIKMLYTGGLKKATRMSKADVAAPDW